MPKKIILIRHGETEYNRKGRWQGWTDMPLNKKGIQQAKQLAERFHNEIIDALFASDLKRALQTAESLAKRLDIKTIPTKKLRERNMGIFEGMDWKEAQEKHKSLFKKFIDHRNETFKDHGGETIKEVNMRIKLFIKEIRKKHKDKAVAIVTHGGTKFHILKLLAKEMPEDLKFGNTAITILKKDRWGEYRITMLSDTSHLEEK